MIKMSIIIKNFVLFFMPVALSVVVIYFFGLSPFLKAQPTGSVSATTAIVSGTISNQNVDKYEEQELKQVETDLLNKANVVPVDDISNGKNDLINNSIANANPTFRTSKNEEFKYGASYIGDLDLPERDPFRKPEDLLRREEDIARPKTPVTNLDEIIDDKMEAIRRWPLSEYKLIGVIWDVKNPKAMVEDQKKTKHLLKKNYRIGNKNGLVSEIGEGSMTVLQEGVPIVITLSGRDEVRPAGKAD